MAFPTSISSFFVVTVCCLIVNAAGEKLPLPFAVDRQFNPMYMVAPPLLNYYNPYGAPILIPTAQGEIVPKLSEDNSKVTERQSSATLTITPTKDTECVNTDASTNGFGGCTKGSRAPLGNFVTKFLAAGQVGVIALVPDANRYSKVKIICSDVTGSSIFTKTFKIAATTDTPVTELKQTQVVIAATAVPSSTACSWEAS